MTTQISKDKIVSLNYKVEELNGDLIDQSPEDQPLVYLHGYANLIPGLEKELAKAKVGDKLQVKVVPEEAYGNYDDSLIQEVSKELFFQDEQDLQEGMLFTAETEQGVVPFYIKKIEGDVITVDGNHLLAGKTLVFDVEVISVRDATVEEISAGIPQLN